jgi:hypothetical protein
MSDPAYAIFAYATTHASIQNKPIELLDGANLLFLLEEKAGIKARIEPPDDWQDPVPDSGEAPD